MPIHYFINFVKNVYKLSKKFCLSKECYQLSYYFVKQDCLITVNWNCILLCLSMGNFLKIKTHYTLAVCRLIVRDKDKCYSLIAIGSETGAY